LLATGHPYLWISSKHDFNKQEAQAMQDFEKQQNKHVGGFIDKICNCTGQYFLIKFS
jgi:hypothetical protein